MQDKDVKIKKKESKKDFLYYAWQVIEIAALYNFITSSISAHENANVLSYLAVIFFGCCYLYSKNLVIKLKIAVSKND